MSGRHFRPRNGINRAPNRLLVAIAVGVGLLFLPLQWFSLRVILAYTVGTFIFLAMLMARILTADSEQTYRRAQREEPSDLNTLGTVALISAASLIAIALMLDNSHKAPALIINIHMWLSLIAIFLSWLLLHTYFALFYARIYYDEPESTEDREGYTGGLDFPNRELVSYWDFLYFSFTIAMCYQTSDVTITNEKMRRVTLIHAIVSFMFVSLILGIVINSVSNLV